MKIRVVALCLVIGLFIVCCRRESSLQRDTGKDKTNSSIERDHTNLIISDQNRNTRQKFDLEETIASLSVSKEISIGEAVVVYYEAEAKSLNEAQSESLARSLGGTLTGNLEEILNVLRNSGSGLLRKTIARQASGSYGSINTGGILESKVYDIKSVYHALPESDVRTEVAQKYLAREYRDGGIEKFFSTLSDLQTQEDRRQSFNYVGAIMSRDISEGILTLEHTDLARLEFVRKNIQSLEFDFIKYRDETKKNR